MGTGERPEAAKCHVGSQVGQEKDAQGKPRKSERSMASVCIDTESAAVTSAGRRTGMPGVGSVGTPGPALTRL